MGEIAEMMLDGTLCQQCGEFIGNDVGYPRYCSACEPKESKKQTSNKPWTNDELSILYQNKDLPVHKLNKLIPTRSYKAIIFKLTKINKEKQPNGI